MEASYKRTKIACFYSYLSMSSIFCVPAMLFVTFHNTYGISYTLLGTLVLVNFCTQLIIDLIFTFFSNHFNIKKTVTVMPFITFTGLFLYALLPTLFPSIAYLGLVIGTILFSISAGLSEVLLTPIVASIPSDNTKRDVSMLHSLYAWGVVLMVLLSVIFLKLFGTSNWNYLVFILSIFPIGAGILFATSPIPNMSLSNNETNKNKSRNIKAIILFVICIFLGSASENIMTNWISSFMEKGLNISKDICDIFGIAIFAFLLGLIRTCYGKFGKKIYPVLLIGMIGATICYLTAGISNNSIIAIIACILTGAFTSMLWPGSLIYMEEKIPTPGVAFYALMAAGGDFGASIAPQLMGIITDKVSQSNFAINFANNHSMIVEQVGLKFGMIISSLFPLCGIIILLIMYKKFKKYNNN